MDLRSGVLFRLMALVIALLAIMPPAARAAAIASPEEATAATMRSLGADQAKLRLFLQRMPKGGDLHNHLGGAIYAEDLIGWADKDGLCVRADRVRLAPAPCDGKTALPAASLTGDYDRYSRAIDALSTRGFERGVGDRAVSGADRFFATFEDFGAAYIGNVGKALALAREQAADDRLAYLELQIGAEPLDQALTKGWSDGIAPTDFPGMLARLARDLPKATAAAHRDLDAMEAEAVAIDRCASPAPAPACAVKVRYLMSAMRTMTPDRVFAELAYGFALVRADPRVVGVDIVAPEHDPVAVRDYRLHMAMFAFLKQRFPQVPLSLHAGELTLGLVPSRDLRFHIHDAVTVAGARRIGHGVDIAYETDALPLLRRMARDRIAVEINLTSNAVILGVAGTAHPLALYRAMGVPVVLATDDEGVSRIDLTNEYLRAVTEQGLGYRDLKAIARDGIEYGFLPGAGLWLGATGGARVLACAMLNAPACAAFAQANEKAATEIVLERQFDAFERDFAPALRTSLSAAR
jgi:adenosine deaminase